MASVISHFEVHVDDIARAKKFMQTYLAGRIMLWAR